VRKLIPLCPSSKKGEIVLLDQGLSAGIPGLPVYGQKSACIALRAKKSNLIMAGVPSCPPSEGGRLSTGAWRAGGWPAFMLPFG